jgi:hypothetical protein
MVGRVLVFVIDVIAFMGLRVIAEVGCGLFGCQWSGNVYIVGFLFGLAYGGFLAIRD